MVTLALHNLDYISCSVLYIGRKMMDLEAYVALLLNPSAASNTNGKKTEAPFSSFVNSLSLAVLLCLVLK